MYQSLVVAFGCCVDKLYSKSIFAEFKHCCGRTRELVCHIFHFSNSISNKHIKNRKGRSCTSGLDLQRTHDIVRIDKAADVMHRRMKNEMNRSHLHSSLFTHSSSFKGEKEGFFVDILSFFLSVWHSGCLISRQKLKLKCFFAFDSISFYANANEWKNDEGLKETMRTCFEYLCHFHINSKFYFLHTI